MGMDMVGNSHHSVSIDTSGPQNIHALFSFDAESISQVKHLKKLILLSG